MADDTLSTDPKMKEEARRAAAESSNPRPPFDPKAIAREEYDRIIDKRYETKGFESLWGLILSELAASAEANPVVGAMSEAEYRQMAASFFYLAQSTVLTQAGKEANERAGVLHKAALYAIHDRLKPTDAKPQQLFADLSRGLIRKVPDEASTKKTCPIHPKGCPDGADLGKALYEILTGKK